MNPEQTMLQSSKESPRQKKNYNLALTYFVAFLGSTFLTAIVFVAINVFAPTSWTPPQSVTNTYDINTGEVTNYDSSGKEITPFRVWLNDGIIDEIVRVYLLVIIGTFYCLFINTLIHRLWARVIVYIISILVLSAFIFILLVFWFFANW